MVCSEPTSTAVCILTTHQDQVITYGSVLKPSRDLPYDVVAFLGGNQVSPLSDRNETRGCQEASDW